MDCHSNLRQQVLFSLRLPWRFPMMYIPVATSIYLSVLAIALCSQALSLCLYRVRLNAREEPGHEARLSLEEEPGNKAGQWRVKHACGGNGRPA